MGELRIGWDQLIQLPSDYNEIHDKKIAIRDWAAFSLEDRESRLSISYYEVYGVKPAELLALIDALEIRILPFDDEFDFVPIDFTWEMTGFSNSFIEI